MDQCCICFEDEEDNDKIQKLSCNHIYHITCLEKWCRENITCPYCRTTITIPVISKVTPSQNLIYKIKSPLRKRETSIIHGIEVSGIYTDLLNQAPECYIFNGFFYNDFRKPNIPTPLYTIYFQGTPVLITLYLRCYLIHFNKDKNFKPIKIEALGGKIYLDTTRNSNYIINASSFPSLYDFTYEIVEFLLDKYQIINLPQFITGIFDIFIEALKIFKVRTKNNIYQLMLATIKVFINNILQLTDNTQLITELSMEENNELILKNKFKKWEWGINDWIMDNMVLFTSADIYF